MLARYPLTAISAISMLISAQEKASLVPSVDVCGAATIFPVGRIRMTATAPCLHQRRQSQKIPRTKTEGREPVDSSWASYGLSGKAGYLRYRKVYSGDDRVLISRNRQPTEEVIA